MENILGLPYKDFITTIALIIGPIIAVQTQKYLEKLQDKKERRLNIFKTLMSTRATPLSQEHIKALNMIDIEFYGCTSFILKERHQNKLEKSVTIAWDTYNQYLNSSNSDNEQWEIKRVKLFTELLYAISKTLNYDFDKLQLQPQYCYRPLAHGEIEKRQINTLISIEEILSGNGSIPIRITNINNTSNILGDKTTNNNTEPTVS